MESTLHSRTRVSRRNPKQLGLLFSALSLSSAFLALPLTAEAAPLFRLENRRENEGAFRLIPEISVMSTKANFNSLGTKEKAGGTDAVNGTEQDLTSYSRTQLDLVGVYGINPAMTLFGRFSISTSKFETTTTSDPDSSGVEGLQGSASGLGDQSIGLNYRVKEFGDKASGNRLTALDFQLQVEFPFYDTKKNRTDRKPLQGDGTTDITVSPFLTVPINQGSGSRFYVISGLGYTARSNSYSAVLPYQLSIAMLPEKSGLLFRGGLYGYKSMKSDTEGTIQLADGSTVRDAGGSYIVDATNSSYMALRGVVGYQNEVATQYYAGFTSMISGKSTAALSALHLGAQFRWGGKSSASTSRSSPRFSGGTQQVRYDLQAQITKAKPEMKIAQINRGTNDGVDVGQIFDFFRSENGKLILVARGVVNKTAQNASNLTIQTYFQQALIQPGFLARRVAP
jgi:hypothetical protein